MIAGNEAGDDNQPALTAAGGGIWAGRGSVVTVAATTIDGNSSVASGGGVAVDRAGLFVLRDSTVSGNWSVDGGGAAVVDSDATFLQTTFYGNLAGRNGGGLFVVSSDFGPTAQVRHSTLSMNVAARDGNGKGGGIYLAGAALNQARVVLDHAIVSGNLHGAPLASDEIFEGPTASGGPRLSARYSLVRDNTGTSLPAGNPDSQGNLIGTPAAPIDARLLPLGSAGGPTLTMVPRVNSPVINAGDPLFSGPPNGDQRLLPYQRVALGRIDMGAVEVQPPPPDPDFNNDGVADCRDIDALVAEIVAGTNTPTFDLNGDGQVNRADLDKWLDDAPDINGLSITRYLYGDANLDAVVDGTDFGIWNSHKFTAAAGWCRGDFNADGRVDGSDFGIWNANKFRVSPGPTGCGLFRGAGRANHMPPDDITDAKRVSAHDVAVAFVVEERRDVVDRLASTRRASAGSPATIDESQATRRLAADAPLLTAEFRSW